MVIAFGWLNQHGRVGAKAALTEPELSGSDLGRLSRLCDRPSWLESLLSRTMRGLSEGRLPTGWLNKVSRSASIAGSKVTRWVISDQFARVAECPLLAR
jgi:hypothetical protein